VSCVGTIFVNDNRSQMSVKLVRLYIKANDTVHDNLGHKDHCTDSSHYYILLLNLPQNLKPPSPPQHHFQHKATCGLTHVKKWKSIVQQVIYRQYNSLF